MSEQHTESPEQQEYERMQTRIEKIFGDLESARDAEQDSISTFRSLGLNQIHAERLFAKVRDAFISGKGAGLSLFSIEASVLEIFKNTLIGQKNLVQILDEKLIDRAKLIFSQIKPYMKNSDGETLDFGAGDLQVTQMLYDAGLNIRGVDVREYRKAGAARPVPFQPYDGKNLSFEDQKFSVSLATNVLHHAGETEDGSEMTEGNEDALRELCRVTKDKLVIIETVPDPSYVDTDPEKAMERTFWNDYLYNRLFHSANVPVPGRYETAEDWPKRFFAHGFALTKVEHLGYDQPTIRDYHILYTFERVTSPVAAIQKGVRGHEADLHIPS